VIFIKIEKVMGKIIITESQLRKLLETGSNSVAMDLDIYTQPTQIDTSNGNENVEETVDEIISKLKELSSMFETGLKVHPELKNRLFGILDDINSNYEKIKYQD
jgi:hypothetical protein